tara:strand:+ start:4171 stop:4977 length:807 start_codon:yes stop_codon:yes gene_type:complete
MKVTFNYTSRKTINPSKYNIDLTNRDTHFFVNCSLDDLSDYGDDDSILHLKLWFRGRIQIIDMGTANIPVIPALRDRRVTIINRVRKGRLQARLEIVDYSTNGEVPKILASSKRFRLKVQDVEEEADGGESLLPIIAKPLGQTPWRLEYDPRDQSPILAYNCSLDALGISDKLETVTLESMLIMPEVFHRILTRVIFFHREISLEGNSWENQWLRFAAGMNPSTLPLNIDDHLNDLDDWIENTVKEFCRRFNIAEQVIESMSEDWRQS